MRLTPRLQAIVDKVTRGHTVADIGTDHGYIPIYLIKNNISPKVIAGDINEGPLRNAQKQIAIAGLHDRVITRLGNGLEILKQGEAETVIISGMGGSLIKDLLLNSLSIVESVKQIILQPMVAQAELRYWLSQHEFNIVDESLAREGNKYYEIMVVERGKMAIDDEIYYIIGKKLLENNDPLLMEYAEMQLRKHKNILKGLEDPQSNNARLKSLEFKKIVQKLEEVLRCLKNAKH